MDLAEAQARIRSLEAELARVKSQRNKAWRDRADIHAQLRASVAAPSGCRSSSSLPAPPSSSQL